MPVDFDAPINRRGTWSSKWDKHPDGVLSLDVGDLDFAMPIEVQRALSERLRHPILGYNEIDPGIGIAVSAHLKRRFDWSIDPISVVLTAGAIPSITVLADLTCGDDGHLILPTPAFPALRALGRKINRPVVEVPLRRISGKYDLDLDRIQDLCGVRSATIILCNPNNPTGTCFSQESLSSLYEIATNTGAWIISDDVHCDLVWSNFTAYRPVGIYDPSQESRIVTVISPSKGFGLSGANCTAVITTNERLKKQLNYKIEGMLCKVSTLSYVAARAAYELGEEWLGQLNTYLAANFAYIQQETKDWNDFELRCGGATSLAWASIGTRDASVMAKRLLQDGLVSISPGHIFGDENSLRMNFGCSRSVLERAFERMSPFFKVD